MDCELNNPLDRDEGAVRTEFSARSELVSNFFDHMNRHDYDWVVMNNYEELPWVIPSDIDFSISHILFSRLDSFVGQFAEQYGARIVQKLWHGNMKCAYILATGATGNPEFVQLDFFTNFSTKGCPLLIDHETLVSGRKKLRNFYVPRAEVELLFTVMRRLFKNDWSSRHCARVGELNNKITHPNWLPGSYEWMQPTLDFAVKGDLGAVKKRREVDWKRLKSTSFGNLSIKQKLENAALQSRRLYTRVRDETGQMVILAAPFNGPDEAALKKLEIVFHRHLTLKQRPSLRTKIQLWILKRRKGLIFVSVDLGTNEGRKLLRSLRSSSLVDQVLCRIEGQETRLKEFDLPFSVGKTDEEAVEAIVDLQFAKTAKAIGLGGTQTSGKTE